MQADATRRIIAAAMKVHSTLGNGFQDCICQRALEIGFPYHDLALERGKHTDAARPSRCSPYAGR